MSAVRHAAEAPEAASVPAPLPTDVAAAFANLMIAVNGAASEDEVFARVAENVGGVLVADRASVTLRVTGRDEIEVTALDGRASTLPRGQRLPLTGSHVGHVMALGRGHVWHPAEGDPWVEAPLLRAQGIASVINGIVTTSTGPLGTINVGSRDRDAYGPAHLDIIAQLGGLIGTAIERHRLLAAARADLDRQRLYATKLECLSEVASRLSAATTEEQVFDVVAGAIASLVDAARVSYVKIVDDGGAMVVRGLTGVDAIPRHHTMALHGSGLESALTRERPTLWADLPSSPSPILRKLGEAGLAWAVSCPVLVASRPEALLNLAFTPSAHRDPDLEPLLAALCRLMGSTLERVRAEEVARHAQRLESLGVLSGGLAHDFNNLLGGALGMLSLLREDVVGQPELSADLADVAAALERCTLLTRQMLAYAGRGTTRRAPVDVHRVLAETAEVVRAGIEGGVALVLELSPPSPRVVGDPAQLQQALLNLMTNAAEAIAPGEGTVTIATRVEDRREAAPSRTIPGHTVPAGRYVVIECADDGCGIPPHLLPRIFEPFFTTKSHGHGLGLSALHGIMRGHGGDLRVESTVGVGTRISLLFPEGRDGELPTADGSRGRALLAEDNAHMRTTAKRMLVKLGFAVVEAADGRAAVELFDRDPAGFRLVLMDQSMPRMTGADAARHIAARSSVPIVMMTGYDREEALHTVLDVVRAVMSKPFDLDELRRTVDGIVPVTPR